MAWQGKKIKRWEWEVQCDVSSWSHRVALCLPWSTIFHQQPLNVNVNVSGMCFKHSRLAYFLCHSISYSFSATSCYWPTWSLKCEKVKRLRDDQITSNENLSFLYGLFILSEGHINKWLGLVFVLDESKVDIDASNSVWQLFDTLHRTDIWQICRGYTSFQISKSMVLYSNEWYTRVILLSWAAPMSKCRF